MEKLILIALAWGAWSGLLALISPLHRCPRCKGARAVRFRRGMSPCPRCKGTGKALRRGAKFIHRTVRSLRSRNDKT